MKLTVTREDLAAAVGFAARTMPKSPPVPVLAGMLLTATGDGTLTASTFDYEIAAAGTATAAVAEPGRRLVSGKLIAEIVKTLPAGRDVAIAEDGEHLTVTCGPAKFKLLTIPADEYPELPVMPDTGGTLPTAELTSAIAAVVLAAGRDGTLPVLTGVMFEPGRKGVTMYATDRYRAARTDAPWTAAGSKTPPGVLIPAAALNAVARGMPRAGKITFGAGAEKGGASVAGFSADGFTIITRLVDGEFPRAIADAFSTIAPEIIADVGQAELVTLVNRVAIAAGKDTPIRLTFGGGHLIARAGDGEAAEATDMIDAGYDGGTFEAAFNPNYLVDAVTPISGTVRLGFTQPTKPALITETPPEKDSAPHSPYRCVLMPIRQP